MGAEAAKKALLLFLSFTQLECLYSSSSGVPAVSDENNSRNGNAATASLASSKSTVVSFKDEREDVLPALEEKPLRILRERQQGPPNLNGHLFRSFDGDLLVELRWPDAEGVEEDLLPPDIPPEAMVASMRDDAADPNSAVRSTMPSLAGRRRAVGAASLIAISILLAALAVHLYYEQVPNGPYMYYLSFSDSLPSRRAEPAWLRLFLMKGFEPSTKVASLAAVISFVVGLIWAWRSAVLIISSNRARAAWLASPSRLLDKTKRKPTGGQKERTLTVRQALERELAMIEALDGKGDSPG